MPDDQRAIAEPRHFGHGRVGRLLVYGVLVFWALVCLFPLYWFAITSVKDEPAIMRGPVYLPFVDFQPTLQSWRIVLFYGQDSLIPRFGNSLVIGIVATLFTLLLASLLVYGLTRHFKDTSGTWPRRIMLGVLASRLLPPAVLVLPFYLMASWTYLLDSRTILILVYTVINLPAAVWLLHPIFGNRATEQEEAAALEGVPALSIPFTIFLPMVFAQVAAVGFLVFLLCWNEYYFAVNLTSDHALTLPPFLVGQMSMKEAQIAGEAEEWAQFSAATLVMVVPLLLGAGLAQKFLTQRAKRI